MLAKLNADTDKAMLVIEDALISELAQYRQTKAHIYESAGVLLGFRRNEHIHIVQATPPGPNDSRSRFAFKRRDHSHQRLAIAGWRDSDKKLDYVGEWHTHPEAQPAPSAQDIHEWKLLCASAIAPLVFVILGTKGLWCGVQAGPSFRRLDLFED